MIDREVIVPPQPALSVVDPEYDEPDDDLPMDWEPDFNAETGRERQLKEYGEKYR